MTNRWLEALKEKEDKHNTAAALHARGKSGKVMPTEKPKTSKCLADRTDRIASGCKVENEKLETPKARTDKIDRNALESERLSLVATWSVEFGYVSMHDPTTGEWHDLPTKEAPSWAIWEARKRKELYKDGNRKAYRLTSREMEKLWREEHPEDPFDGDVATDKRGIVYEDYLSEDVNS